MSLRKYSKAIAAAIGGIVPLAVALGYITPEEGVTVENALVALAGVLVPGVVAYVAPKNAD